MNQELLDALTRMPPIPDLAGAVLAALGVGDERAYRDLPVLGYHTSVGTDTASVYVVTDRVFAMFEANAAGRSYTLSVAVPRIRRVGRFEDADYTRVIVELDADRTTTRSTMDAEGRTEGTIIPAGYELLETDPAGRVMLRRFQTALTAAISA